MTKLAHSYSAIKLFENCPLRYYEQKVTKSIKDEGGEASIHGDRVHKSIEAKLKGTDELPADMSPYGGLIEAVSKSVGNGTLEVEKELTVTQRMKPCGWWDEDAWLRSKLDVLVMKGPDAVVMDWKTGKRRVDMFQLRLFAAQTFLHYPAIQKIEVILVWLKTMESDREVYHRVEAPELWRDVLGRIRRIEGALEANVWPARPSGLCPYCPLFKTCKYAKR